MLRSCFKYVSDAPPKNTEGLIMHQPYLQTFV